MNINEEGKYYASMVRKFPQDQENGKGQIGRLTRSWMNWGMCMWHMIRSNSRS